MALVRPVLLRSGTGTAMGLHPAWTAGRAMSSSATISLKERLEQLIPEKQKEVQHVKKTLGKKSLGETTVDMAYGGMRGVPGLIWECSLLDANEVGRSQLRTGSHATPL